MRHGPEREVWKLFSLVREMVPAEVRLAIRSVMIERYLRDTTRVADSYYYTKIPEHTSVDKQDVRQAAYDGMMEAFDAYDWRVGTTFMQWAAAKRGSRIKGAIVDMLRRLMEFPRRIAEYRREINPMMEKLKQKLGITKPTIEDFIKEYGEDYRYIFADELFAAGVFNQHQVSEDNESSNKTSLDALSAIEDFRKNYDSEVDWNTEDRASFHEVFLGVITDDRERFAVYAYHFLQWNNETIAKSKTMNCSTSTALAYRINGERRIKAAFTYEEAMERIHQFKS